MNIARLGAAGAAAGVAALCAAAPAFAAPAPVPGGVVGKAAPSAPAAKPPDLMPSADVNPTSFSGGDTLTYTVRHCPVQPTIVDLNHLFVTTHPFVTTVKDDYAAKETVREDLVEGRKYTIVVHCGRWTHTFTKKPTPTSPRPTGVPSGAPQTGDGSSGGGGGGLVAGGAAVVLAGLAGGTFLYTRRRSSARA